MKSAWWSLIGASVLSVSCASRVLAADGALDATFGSGGKVQMGPVGSDSSPVANDVAVQADGKIVMAGYESFMSSGSTHETWRIDRLNLAGEPDTTFGTLFEFGGDSPTRAQAIALRPDGRILVGGTTTASGHTSSFVLQALSDGNLDLSWGTGSALTELPVISGDSVYLSRLVVDSDGSIDVAGTYYDNQNGFNSNEFFFARISPDGKTIEPFQYQFGTGPNQDDHALDLAIDSQGRYVVAGYHRGAAGNYDCAVIRIDRDLYDVDTTFGNAGQTTIGFDYGGDNGDFCNVVAVFKHSDYIAIGGHATADAGGDQEAIVAMLDNNGQIVNPPGIYTHAEFGFTYDGGPPAGTANTINKFIVDDDDTKTPQLLAIGSGFKTGLPYGDAFGIARLNLPFYINFTLDTSFNGSGTQNVYFAECPTGLGSLQTHNYANSAAYANGKLVVAGYTNLCGGGTDIAVARLAAFDRIFEDGLDSPSY